MAMWWGLWAAVTAVSGVLLAGLLTPATRSGVHEAVVAAPVDAVRHAILDVQSQPAWRRDVTAVDVDADSRRWTERTRAGETVRFERVDAGPHRIVLRFDSSRGYAGEWTGELEATPDGGTRIRVRESATVPNPIARLVARIAFDPEAFARQWATELAAELARRGAAR